MTNFSKQEWQTLWAIRLLKQSNDGGTLSNHTKYQALGLQFISERGDANLVICVGLARSAHDKDADVADSTCRSRPRKPSG
mmetsp:Transcript_38439/g.101361  ORF Transcript_38439/g.101361 Transcript_38439/m.101361 type:complete len:81 (+) Transcript_38439:394-636(+)